MPAENRQIQPSENPGTEVLGDVWRLAPTGLALLDGGAVVAWNPAARRLLAASVGGSPTAWRRWLESAALRLRDQPGAVTVLEARRPEAPALEIESAGLAGRAGFAVIAMRPAMAAAPGGALGLAETVSTLSHELRTPLAAMKSSLSLVLAGDAGPLGDDQKRFLGVALRNATRLDRLVGDLLDVSCADAGRLPFECRSVDLGPVLREALALFDATTDTVGPSLDMSGIPDHFPACVDADKLVQIVSNLVGNARKYVPPEGRVRVWLDPHSTPPGPLATALAQACGVDARTFALVVEDNGPGIDPQIVDRVFEPFERGRHEVIGSIGGAGLGLHIVRRLTEAHGGKVSLATAPGAGTTVWVRLPLEPVGGRVLKAAAQLAAALEMAAGDHGTVGCLAVFDAREAGAGGEDALARGRACLASPLPGAVGSACEPVPGLLALAVADPEAWRNDGRATVAGWRLLGPDARVPGSLMQPAIQGKPVPGPADNDS